MIDLAEMTVPITLGGVERRMVFDLNTFAAYQEKTKRSFLADVVPLYDILQPLLPAELRTDKNLAKDAPAPTALDILAKIPMDTLKVMLWACIHEYDENDKATWPLSPDKIGKLINIKTLPSVFTSMLVGNSQNSPTDKEMGESQGPTERAGTVTPIRANGGAMSTELQEAAFALPSGK